MKKLIQNAPLPVTEITLALAFVAIMVLGA